MVACIYSQQHARVSQGQICSGKCTCCHTEIEVADQTFYITQSQYIDTGSTCPSADPITPGAWQGSHWRVNILVNGMTRPRKIPAESNTRSVALEADTLTTGPSRRFSAKDCLDRPATSASTAGDSGIELGFPRSSHTSELRVYTVVEDKLAFKLVKTTGKL